MVRRDEPSGCFVDDELYSEISNSLADVGLLSNVVDESSSGGVLFLDSINEHGSLDHGH